jgi:1,4-alpha-glucan branching enzyme
MGTPSFLSDDDLYLFGEGSWLFAYEKLGAHPRVVDDVAGVNFAVWAPGARHVRVEEYGFGRRLQQIPMALRGPIGVWELFVPGMTAGATYKYGITSRYGDFQVEKADPFGVWGELRPANASVVYDLGGYAWHDAAWMGTRDGAGAPGSLQTIYEVHLGSWRRGPDGGFLNYRQLAEQLVPYVTALGFTHIELLPVAEHPFDPSWGYQLTGYFAPTSRFGTPHDLMFFVDYCHQHGLGVLMDWVPAHFAKDRHGLYFFDGTHLYEHADPRRGEHLGWGTAIFNYERPEVVSFLLSNAVYWLQEYHIDGLRIDAVSAMLYRDYERPAGAWVPNDQGGRESPEAIAFLRRVNDTVHRRFPGAITCAEEATAWPGVTRSTADGGLGFDFKWNMGWMNDVLRYLDRPPASRPAYHNEVTFSYTYAFAERYLLPLSHDEVVHLKHALLNKAPGPVWQRFATLRALLAAMYAHPGKKLLFMGGETAQEREWSEATPLDWSLLDGPAGIRHRQVQRLVTELNRLYRAEPALHALDTSPQGFAWIDGSDAEHSIVAILRRSDRPDDVIAVVCNWQPLPQADYPIGVPVPGRWEELLNTDATAFGGFGVGNVDGVDARSPGIDGYPYTLTVTIPPLGVLWLQPTAARRGGAGADAAQAAFHGDTEYP